MNILIYKNLEDAMSNDVFGFDKPKTAIMGLKYISFNYTGAKRSISFHEHTPDDPKQTRVYVLDLSTQEAEALYKNLSRINPDLKAEQ